MPSRLTPSQRETLIKFCECGPGANYHLNDIARLYRLGMIQLSEENCIELTDEGSEICDLLRSEFGGRAPG